MSGRGRGRQYGRGGGRGAQEEAIIIEIRQILVVANHQRKH